MENGARLGSAMTRRALAFLLIWLPSCGRDAATSGQGSVEQDVTAAHGPTDQVAGEGGRTRRHDVADWGPRGEKGAGKHRDVHKGDTDDSKADKDQGKADKNHGKGDKDHGKGDKDHGKGDKDDGKGDKDEKDDKNDKDDCEKGDKDGGKGDKDGDCNHRNDKCKNVVCAPLDQCHLAGTCDPTSGKCSNPTKPDGAGCDDRNACTSGDACKGGACTGGPPLACDDHNACTADGCDPATGCTHALSNCDDGNACTVDACDPTSGCTHAPLNCDDGDPCTVDSCAVGVCQHGLRSCDDNNLCTTDSCVGGECRHAPAVTCTALDQCHVAGTCNPATGVCSNPNAANGSFCTDSNACTVGDTCQSGLCQSGALTTCTALDQCHVSGTCNPATGVCSNPNAANGSFCTDSNACTVGDTCQSGLCHSGTLTTCSPLDQCHVAGTCNPATGVCPNPNAVDGTACTGTNRCFQSYACQSGACTGANPVVCAAAQCTCSPGAQTDILLDFHSLPSAQGWTYTALGNAAAESAVFSVAGGVLTQNTMGLGFASQGYNRYGRTGVVDATRPFVVTVRARVLAEEGDTNTNSFGFAFGVFTGAEVYGVGLGAGRVEDISSNFLTTAADNSQFHVYRLEGAPGVGYRLFVDGVLLGSGPARPFVFPNQLFLGDSTGGTNARAEITNYEFTQALGPSCQGPSGACTPADAAFDQCHTAGQCDPATGVCSVPALPDGTACTDNNACTTGDSCQNGTCQSGTPVVCTAPDACRVAGVCDPGSGACSSAAVPDGTACSDGNLCHRLTCQAGACAQTGGVRIDFESLTPGVSVEGLGAVHPLLDITTTSGRSVVGAEGDNVNGTYGAPNNAPVGDGCLGNPGRFAVDGRSIHGQGFADLSAHHDYVFTFAPGVSVTSFSLLMLDFGDLNPTNATNHHVELVAYDALHNPVDRSVLAYTSDGAGNPRSGSAGDLFYTGDACTAQPGQPGNFTFQVNGAGIARVELQITAGIDPNIAFDNIQFTPDTQCDDGNPCTADACAPTTGCTHTPLDGTACSDGNLCTTNDSCHAGLCVGTQLACTATDGCHLAGTCAPATGLCTNPPAPDGTVCGASGGANTNPASCLELLQLHPGTPSGVYTLATGPAYCDMVSDGGGWTLFGNIVSGGFDYAATTTTAIGTAVTNGNALAAKPAGTVGRIVIAGADFQIDAAQSAPSAAYAPSMDSTVPSISFDTLLGQSGNASVTLAAYPISLGTSKTGYQCGGSIVFIDGAHGSTIDGYTYNGSPQSGCAGNNVGFFWVPQQIPGCANDYVFKNTMEIANHLNCNNQSTGVFAKQVQLYFRGNACTTPSTCQSGACVAGNPVTCNAPDQCHAPPACNPATGACPNVLRPDGGHCSGSAYRIADTLSGPAITNLNTDFWEWTGTSVVGCGTPSYVIDSSGLTLTGEISTLDEARKWALAGDFKISVFLSTPATARTHFSIWEYCHVADTSAVSRHGFAGGGLPAVGLDGVAWRQGGSGYFLFEKVGTTFTIHQGDANGVSDASPVVASGTVGQDDYFVLFAQTGCPAYGTLQLRDLVIEACNVVPRNTPLGSPPPAWKVADCRVAGCAALDGCHAAGTCDMATGFCSNPAAANGTACSDGNACTVGDSCQGGVCAGGAATACAASDQCHLAGVCDPTNGQCSNPAAPDGTACNDNNACTTADACHAGACAGTPSCAATITVSPPNATVPLFGTQPFTATAFTAGGQVIAPSPAFMWSDNGGGTISATGVFMAGGTPGGPFTITASAQGVQGTAMVTVADAAPTVATAASAMPSPVTGATTALSVLGADDGGEASLSYTWSASGPAAISFSANGTNAAKNTSVLFTAAGSYVFQVVIADAAGLTVTSSVPVTVLETLAGVTVSPPGGSFTVGGSAQFAAHGIDQFGHADTAALTWLWSVVSGPAGLTLTNATSATVDASFGAPGSFTLRATASDGTATASADAAITVAPVAPTPDLSASTPDFGAGAADGGSEMFVGPAPPHAIVRAAPARARRGASMSVFLDGSGSTGAGLAYRWFIGSATLLSGTVDDPAIRIAFAATGDLPVALRVSNSAGTSTASTVIAVDDPPVASAGPDRVVFSGTTVTLDGSGTVDREGDPITYAWQITASPTGGNGMLTGPATATPQFSAGTPGTYTVQLVAADALGPAPAALVNVRVITRSQNPPTVTLTASPGVAAVGSAVALQVTASGDNAIATTALTINGTAVTLDGSGRASFTPGAPGTFEGVATATDIGGNSSVARTRFFAHAVGAVDDGPPTVSIAAPADGAVLTGATDVVGTVTDPDLAGYTVELSEHGQNRYARVASGTSAVTNAKLGTIDTTLFTPGTYDLRLQAFDAFGNVASALRQVVLDQTATVGNPHFRLVDVSISLAGMPITVARSYDSADRRDGDFGADWTLDTTAGDHIEETNVAGDGWFFDNAGPGCRCILGSCSCCDFGGDGTVETRSHLVTFRVEGHALVFRFAPTFNGCITGAEDYTAHWVPVGNTFGSTLSGEGDGTPLFNLNDGSNQLVDQGTFNIYDPQTFTITFPDGRQNIVGVKTGLQAARDSYGNSITIDSSGITHSAGLKVSFVRDASNHITRITLPDGNSRTYQYSSAGDLIASTNFSGGTTRYFYGAEHMLRQVIDPQGNAILTSQYDASGRITSLIDGTGLATNYNYDLPNRTVTTVDRAGASSTVTYDARGNVTAKTSAAGQTVHFEYDAAGNPTAQVDVRGNRTVMTYNTFNEETSRALPTGITQLTTYDSAGRTTSHTDGLGHTESWTYDVAGKVASRTDLEGGTVTAGRDTHGMLATLTMPAGGIASLTHDANGFLTAITDLSGLSHTLTNDLSGRPTADSVVVNGTTYLSTATYDGSGSPTSFHGRDGSNSTAAYDADQHPSAIGDAFGGTAHITYGPTTIPTRTLANGGLIATTYDAVGRKTSETSPEGRTTRTLYDAFGRTSGKILPGGAQFQYSYDGFGSVTSAVDPFGGTTMFTYDALGRLKGSVDAAGLATTRQYDSLSRIAAETDTAGVTSAFTYNGRGDVLTQSVNGATPMRYAYDAAGRRTGITDPVGNQTTIQYDGASRVTHVTDAGGGAVVPQYNGFGMTSLTDPNGHTATYDRDPAGNITRRTLPAGESESLAYDRANRTTTRTGFDVRRTTFQFDLAQHLVATQAQDGTRRGYGIDRDGYLVSVSDGAGAVLLARDAAGRLALQTEADGALVSYTYDSAGYTTSMTTPFGTTNYTRDALGRTTSVTDPAGRTTTLAYDGRGLLGSIQYPNGVTEARTYDGAARLASVSARNGAATLFAETYAYDAADRPTSVTDGVSGGRVDYGYDGLNRLISETITPQGGVAAITRYTYDAGGNLTGIARPSGNTTLTYDADDRLTSDGVATYTYDGEGRLASVAGGPSAATYAHDGLGRLVHVVTTGAALGNHTVDYVYDGTDLVVSRTIDGDRHGIVWDRSQSIPRILYETDAQGGLYSRATWAGPALLKEWAGGVHVLHRDRLGSVRVATDATGAASAITHYTGYGEVADAGAVLDDHIGFGFAGERFDPVTGNYFLRARWYAPRLGRFLSPDEGQPDLANTQSFNRYIYGASSPTINVDPTGRQFDLGSMMVTMAIQTSLMTAYFNYVNTAVSTIAAELGLAFAIRAINVGRSYGTHLFDWSRPSDASVRGSSFGGTVGGVGYQGGIERVSWYDRFNGQPPPARSAWFTYHGYVIGGGINPTISGTDYTGYSWGTPTPEGYAGDNVSISVGFDFFGALSKDFEYSSGFTLTSIVPDMKVLSVGLSAQAAIGFAPLPDEACAEDQQATGEEFSQGYGFNVGRAASASVPLTTQLPLSFTFAYVYYNKPFGIVR